MNLYPALKAKMGDWDYYAVKMKMKDLAKEVAFASEVHNDATLDEAIQRGAFGESREGKHRRLPYVRGRIASLRRSSSRRLGGNATFYPVSISDDAQFRSFCRPRNGSVVWRSDVRRIRRLITP